MVLYDGYLIPFMSLCKIFAGIADGNMYIFNKYTSPAYYALKIYILYSLLIFTGENPSISVDDLLQQSF